MRSFAIASVLFQVATGATGLGTYYEELANSVPRHYNPHAVPGYTTVEWGPPIVMSAPKQAVPCPIAAPPPPCHTHSIFKRKTCYKMKSGKHAPPPPPPRPVVHETRHTNQKIYEDSSIDVHVNILNSAVPVQMQSQNANALAGQAGLQGLGMPEGLQGAMGPQQAMRPPQSQTYRPLPAGQAPHHHNLPWVPGAHSHYPKPEWVPGPPHTFSSCRYAGKSCLRLRSLLTK